MSNPQVVDINSNVYVPLICLADASGNPYTASSGASANRAFVSIPYKVITAATGYAIGDILDQVEEYNTATTPSTRIDVVWYNRTQETTLSSAPLQANITPQVGGGSGNVSVISSVLPTGAATSANQATEISSLASIVTALAGNLNVKLVSLISGEDQTRGWTRTVNGASQSYTFSPIPNAVASGSVANANNIIGTIGAAGDYLQTLVIRVTNATNAAIFLDQGTLAPVLSGTSGTNPDGTVNTALVASSAFSATANQYHGSVLMVTYTPTGSLSSVTVPRKIVTHAIVSSSTAVTFALTHALPAGATITAWQILDKTTCREIQPFNALPGAYNITFGEASTYGAWKISVDSGVQVRCIGSFT